MLPLSISCVVLPSETINVVLIPAISDAIDALNAVDDPDIALFLSFAKIFKKLHYYFSVF